MDAPVCRTCGKKHWSRLCDGEGAVTKRPVALPEPRSVTVKPERSVTGSTAFALEIDALRAEVAMLKRKLAEAGTVQTACPECERRRAATAERVRKSRERRKP
jgi:hypothetical protein